MRISDWSSDVCSSDLNAELRVRGAAIPAEARGTIAVDAFCDLAPRDDIDAAIETAERNLAAAGQQDAVREARLFEPLTLPGLDVDALVAPQIGRAHVRTPVTHAPYVFRLLLEKK